MSTDTLKSMIDGAALRLWAPTVTNTRRLLNHQKRPKTALAVATDRAALEGFTMVFALVAQSGYGLDGVATEYNVNAAVHRRALDLGHSRWSGVGPEAEFTGGPLYEALYG